MNNLKSIFLGSALAVVAVTGAQAADPILGDVKAAREPVYRCDITGFIELPGTDICWKIGGRARFVAWGASDAYAGRAPDPFSLGVVTPGGVFIGNPGQFADGLQTYGQARLNFDARTVTEYGTVRGFIEVQANNNGGNTGGALNLRHAFVQFGNWTFGKTWSTYLHLGSSPAYLDPATVVGDMYMRRDQIRYTQSFGNGFAVSVALEDPNYNAPVAITALNGGVPGVSTGLNGSNNLPDLVGSLNYGGDWGDVQLSGALHQNEYYGISGAGVTYEDDELGWAVLFGMVLNAPWAGEGDAFALKASYADNAQQYAGATFIGGGTNVYWGDCDGVFATVGDCILGDLSSWSILASFAHNWTPTVATTLGGGYSRSDFDSNLAPVGFATPLDNVNTWEIFANVEWTPVSRTSFMLDIHYGNQTFEYANPFIADDEADGVWGGFQVTRSF